nr:PREDICTED: golgi-specific brefeldin A-resistance guanine nucleotide exchange factor 1-like [Equus przewalskii]
MLWFARMVDKSIYIIQGEINIVVGAIKRNARWSTHTPLDEERDPLLHSFSHLKEVLNNITGRSIAHFRWAICRRRARDRGEYSLLVSGPSYLTWM